MYETSGTLKHASGRESARGAKDEREKHSGAHV